MLNGRKTGIVVVLVVIGGLIAFGVLFFARRPVPEKEIAVVKWREDFISAFEAGRNGVPEGWGARRKPGTRAAVFSVVKGTGKEGAFLHMEADDASASLITAVRDVDIVSAPVLRWRWRATVLPKGADGRRRPKDDQAIGIYVGTGSALSSKCVSYRWDTETPKGSEGKCAYGLGSIRVKWFTLRNNKDAGDGRWFIEERNVADDFNKAWGFYPKQVYVSVSCNSQYTGTEGAADLDWIEFDIPQAE